MRLLSQRSVASALLGGLIGVFGCGDDGTASSSGGGETAASTGSTRATVTGAGGATTGGTSSIASGQDASSSQGASGDATSSQGSGGEGGATPQGSGGEGGATAQGSGGEGGATAQGSGGEGGATAQGSGGDGGATAQGSGGDGGATAQGSGGDGGDSPQGSGGDGGGSTSSAASTTSSTGTSSSTGAGPGEGCTAVTIDDLQIEAGWGYYNSTLSPEVGLPYEDRIFFAFRDEATGTFDLADEASFNCIGHCIDASVDYDAGPPSWHFFRQASGTLVVEPWSVLQANVLGATFTDLVLVEPGDDGEPLPDGQCLYIDSYEISIGAGPDGWTCSPAWYGNDICDCGCGIQDADCGSTTNPLECFPRCGPSAVPDPADTTQCLDVPDAWTCSAAWYARANGCDCGCGAIDLDCGGNASPDACSGCPVGSCANDGVTMTGCVGILLDEEDNAICGG